MITSMRVVAAAVSVVLLAVPGCTDDGAAGSDPSPTTTAGTPSPTESPTPEALPTFEADPFEPEDVVLDVAIKDPTSLDPMRLHGQGSYLVARQLYEGLTRYDPAAQTAVPAVAESWRVENGGRRFVFTLREGLTFHDGSPVTAEDFVFAFDRIAVKRNASQLAYVLDRVKGFEAVNRRGRADHLAGLRAVDPRTLVIDLSEPYHDLPLVLTHPALVPLSERSVRRVPKFLSQPVGNGAFEIALPWAPGRPVVLEAYAGFPQPPQVDGIRFVPYPDVASGWIDLIGGGLDVAEVPVGEFDAARDEFGAKGFRPSLSGYYYGLNIRAPALKDRRARLAVNLAVDRAAIASDIFGGTMEPARGIVPAGVPGFEGHACSTLCTYSPEAARALVARLDPEQRRVALQYTAGPPHDEVAEAVAQDLRAVGLTVRVQRFRFSDYVAHIERGRHSMFRLGWIAEYPLADVFLSSLFASDSPDNYSGFASKRVGSLLARAHGEPSEDVRRDLYVQVEREILRALPILPIGYFTTHWVARPEIEGMEFDILGGFDASGVSIRDA